MANFFRQFRGLSYSNKWRFCGIVFFVPVLKLCLKLFGFKRTVNLLKRYSAEKPASGGNTIAHYKELGKLCYDFFPVDGMCLPVSLLFWRMLRQNGIETKLLFGTRKSGEKLTAHAWIECGGIPVTAGRDVNKKFKALEIPLV